MTHLAYLSLYVNDLSASRQFYGDYLGLPVVEDEEWGVILALGDASLFLHPRETGDVQHVELTFDVDDADTMMAALRERGVRVLDEVADRAWGDRDGAVADPDGNTVYLRSRSAAQA
jgi:catechol 2,3-dioxygenase-like lactoylglutathione lyase family enzyme